ncbi:MAG TPA: nicotinate-nucleotide--dimethylbenzimidazole phosphoribosyltransferase [Kofleriaceae bacterium]|nr:nicotinate-nucleotide--dimethylbenzimidazole phosphoribosyltransferase [Kofleriaceae bacterium]
MSQVLQHVIEAIGPASQANAEAVRARIAQANAPVLEQLAARLAGAQHTPKPRSAKRMIVVVAGDHGAGDPGIAMGADHPTVVAARAIADGSAALCQLARSSSAVNGGAMPGSSIPPGGTPIVLVDAGSREPSHMPDIAIQLGRGPSLDILREPAMTVVDAALGLDAGIALSITLSEQSPDVLALGAIGVGSDVASAAILAAVTGQPPGALRDDVAEAAGIRGMALRGAGALEILATFGGSDTAVLAGLILGAASMNVPVILDSYATGAAALIAAQLARPVTGYMIAAHRGSFTQPAILDHLGLSPAFDVGLGHGEGAGAAMVLPLLDQVTALAQR